MRARRDSLVQARGPGPAGWRARGAPPRCVAGGLPRCEPVSHPPDEHTAKMNPGAAQAAPRWTTPTSSARPSRRAGPWLLESLLPAAFSAPVANGGVAPCRPAGPAPLGHGASRARRCSGVGPGAARADSRRQAELDAAHVKRGGERGGR